jgi:hypothetical protein
LVTKVKEQEQIIDDLKRELAEVKKAGCLARESERGALQNKPHAEVSSPYQPTKPMERWFFPPFWQNENSPRHTVYGARVPEIYSPRCW